jgi:CRP/FNR family transcriptional regulator, anaerobic regulatory protein
MENFYAYLKNRAGLKEEEVLLLTANLKTKTVEKGEYLLKFGEICHNSFYVEKGLLRSFTIEESGKEYIIQFASENWFISDRSSTFFHEPSDMYIDAIEQSTVIYIDTDFIHKVCELSPSFREYNELALHNHIRHLQKRINLLLAAHAEQRYLDFIQLYPDITLRVPQWMIASYLGITPESLSRVRKELAMRNFNPPQN